MFKKIDFRTLSGDVFGGITAGIVALPLALAFGVQSGLGAIAGLYGAMVLGIFAAIFGGTATQVSGPTGPMTVVSAMVIGSAIEMTGSLEAGMGIIIASFLLAGGFQIIFGLVKIGRYIRYIPYPVLSGFMTGIGVIIILFQIYPFMGHASAKSTIDIILNIGEPLSKLNWSATILATATVTIIYTFGRVTKAVPSTLVALIVMTLISYLMNLHIPLIGDIPSGIPTLKTGSIAYLKPDLMWTIIEFAATLAALGAIDSLLTSLIADNLTKTKHNSDRELIGQGIGNMLSALIGGLPGAGATMRTVVNIKSGGKTRLSGFIHGLLLVAILLGLGRLAAYIPLCVLAGILITVGIGIIDYKGISHLRHMPKTDSAILIIVLLITVFGNLLHAVGVGVVLASLLFMKQASELAEQGTTLKALSGADAKPYWPDEDDINEKYRGKIYVKHINGPLFFGFTSKFQESILQIEDDIKILIVRMENVPHIDQSGIYAMEDSIAHLREKKVVVAMTGLQPQPLSMFKKINIVPTLVPVKLLFKTFDECKKWLADYVKA